MSAPHRCLHCGQALDLADTNVSTDVALCRACGRSMSFSAVASTDEPGWVDLADPPRGVKVGHSLISGIEVTYRRFNPAVLFLIPFTALWSGVSLGGIYVSQLSRGTFDLGLSLTGLPFLLGTLVLLGVIAYMLFGRWRVHIDRGTAQIFNGIGPIGRRREVALVPGTKVHMLPSKLRVNGRQRTDICITTDGRSVRFGASLPDDARQFLAALLNKAVPRT
jgi:hypothetical protein